MMPHRTLVSLLVAFALLFDAQRALAFEDQWHLGAGLGVVNASPSSVGLGIGVNAFTAYGLSDMFDAKLDVTLSGHPVELAGTSTNHGIYNVALGLAYKIDVIEWIPYFGIQAGYMLANLPADDLGLAERDVTLGGTLGLDYALSRSFGLGVTNRLYVPLSGGSLIDLFLRAEYRWGW